MTGFLNDRDTEMAAGSAWTTQPSDGTSSNLLHSIFGDVPVVAPAEGASSSATPAGIDQALPLGLLGQSSGGLQSDGLDPSAVLGSLSPDNVGGISPLTL